MSPVWPMSEGSVKRLEKRRDVDGLLAALDHKKPEIVEAAAAALGRIGDPSAVAPLLAHVSDERRFVRLESVKALGRLGDPAAAVPLAKRLAELWAAVASLTREVTEPFNRVPASPERVRAATAADVLAEDAEYVLRAIDHLADGHDLPLADGDLHLLAQIADEAGKAGGEISTYGFMHFPDLPVFLLAGTKVTALNKLARSAKDKLERRRPSEPVTASADTRDVTFTVPCGECGYRTAVTVRMDWSGHILSGNEFGCQNCGRMFTVPMETLIEETRHFV